MNMSDARAVPPVRGRTEHNSHGRCRYSCAHPPCPQSSSHGVPCLGSARTPLASCAITQRLGPVGMRGASNCFTIVPPFLRGFLRSEERIYFHGLPHWPCTLISHFSSSLAFWILPGQGRPQSRCRRWGYWRPSQRRAARRRRRAAGPFLQFWRRG